MWLYRKISHPYFSIKTSSRCRVIPMSLDCKEFELRLVILKWKGRVVNQVILFISYPYIPFHAAKKHGLILINTLLENSNEIQD